MKSMIIRLISAAALAVLVFGSQEARAQEFKYQVEHDHLYKSCKGELIINQDGVEYWTDNKDHARKWSYTDIKLLKLASPKKVEVVSYESGLKTIGRDKSFQFKVLEGEITEDVSEFLLARVARPLTTSFVATEEKAQYEIPVRHQHRFGGCQGTLRIFADRIVYESDKEENSRYWRWSDIQSISRTGPYQFSVTTYEAKFGGSKTYNFDLKERMEDTVYEFAWARVNRVTLPGKPLNEQEARRIQP